MSETHQDSLPIAQRLALSYVSAGVREDSLTLLLLDNRLAGVLRQRSEIIIAQMKMAWWRDRLAENPEAWPLGEPLLDRLRLWHGKPVDLAPLVNGWERLLADDLTMAALEEFAEGRAQAWRALASAHAADHSPHDDLAMVHSAAREWALADLAIHLGDQDEAKTVQNMMQDMMGAKAGGMVLGVGRAALPLPRQMRCLAVMRGLALRALERGSRDVLDGPLSMAVALRIGMTGR